MIILPNKDFMIKMKNILFDALFPHICVCGRWGEVICVNCLAEIVRTKTQLCPICKKISKNGKTCSACRNRSFLTGVMIFGDHEGKLKDIIWTYKYEFIRELSEPLAQLLTEKFSCFIKEKKFVITCVPISKSRYQWRGFNQSLLLGRNLSNLTDLSFVELLTTKRKNKPQVGLSKKERAKNIEDKINVLDWNRTKINGKRILIVDDVYTTGSTLEACAKIMRQNGAKEVWGIVLSRD